MFVGVLVGVVVEDEVIEGVREDVKLIVGVTLWVISGVSPGKLVVSKKVMF